MSDEAARYGRDWEERMERRWQPPDVQNGESTKNAWYDFWVETHTKGTSGEVYMNGERLRGVLAVKTDMSVDSYPKVTITFIARTLNKGPHP